MGRFSEASCVKLEQPRLQADEFEFIEPRMNLDADRSLS
jgi:hypothetical protein